jgi:hypothetical protein
MKSLCSIVSGEPLTLLDLPDAALADWAVFSFRLRDAGTGTVCCVCRAAGGICAAALADARRADALVLDDGGGGSLSSHFFFDDVGTVTALARDIVMGRVQDQPGRVLVKVTKQEMSLELKRRERSGGVR